MKWKCNQEDKVTSNQSANSNRPCKVAKNSKEILDLEPSTCNFEIPDISPEIMLEQQKQNQTQKTKNKIGVISFSNQTPKKPVTPKTPRRTKK